jgi:Uma2 family endonuclease
VRTVVLGPRPPELEAVLERRRALGQDLYDEVWEGEYHMSPAPSAAHALLDHLLAVLLEPLARRAGLVGSGAFNLGRPEDYRVPDRGLHRVRPTGVWVPTAAVVVEILSPDDETFEKFGFYARHRVDEVLVVDPVSRAVRCWRLAGESYVETETSELLGGTVADLARDVDWP